MNICLRRISHVEQNIIDYESVSFSGDWYNVDVNVNNKVIALKLNDNNLIGTTYFNSIQYSSNKFL